MKVVGMGRPGRLYVFSGLLLAWGAVQRYQNQTNKKN